MSFAESIGADHIIDYTLQGFTSSDDQYDVIFDLLGNHALKAIRRVLCPGGILVGCGERGSDKPASELLSGMVERLATSPFTSQKLTGALAKVKTADLNLFADLLQSGKIESALDRSDSPRDVAEVIRHVGSCQARGIDTIRIA